MTFTINVHTPKSPLLTSPAPLVGPGSLDPSLLGATCLSQFPSAEGLVKRKLPPQVHSGFCYKTRSQTQGVSLPRTCRVHLASGTANPPLGARPTPPPAPNGGHRTPSRPRHQKRPAPAAPRPSRGWALCRSDAEVPGSRRIPGRGRRTGRKRRALARARRRPGAGCAAGSLGLALT